MTSEAIKLKKLELQQQRERQLIGILTNPIVELVAGITAIEQLYRAGAFGPVSTSSMSFVKFTPTPGTGTGWGGLFPPIAPPAGTTSTTYTQEEVTHSTKQRDALTKALYISVIVQQLAPAIPGIMPLAVQGVRTAGEVGGAAIGALGKIAGPALGAVTSVIGV